VAASLPSKPARARMYRNISPERRLTGRGVPPPPREKER
jgi:hypothetical protein